MEFSYRVVAKNGERLSGRLVATDQRRARELLASKHSAILELRVLDSESQEKLDRAYRVPAADMAVFFRRLSTMLGAGVQLAEALEFLARSEEEDGFRAAIEDLSRAIMSGSSLSQAFGEKKFRKLLNPVHIGMLRMGEQTGEMRKVIEKIADQMEKGLRLKRSLTSSLTYPAMLFAAIVFMTLLFALVLGSDEGGLFAAFGQELPWPTRMVQRLSALVREPWLLLGVPAALVASVLWFRWRLETNQSWRLKCHRFLLEIPGLGSLIHKAESASLLYTMSDGLAVGLPLTTCLQMGQDVCWNEKVKADLRLSFALFSNGEEFTTALVESRLFSNMVLSMLEVGVESGRLDLVMSRICRVYEEEVEMALENLSRLAEPLLLTLAGAVAGFFAIATLLPIINMAQTL